MRSQSCRLKFLFLLAAAPASAGLFDCSARALSPAAPMRQRARRPLGLQSSPRRASPPRLNSSLRQGDDLNFGARAHGLGDGEHRARPRPPTSNNCYSYGCLPQGEGPMARRRRASPVGQLHAAEADVLADEDERAVAHRRCTGRRGSRAARLDTRGVAPWAARPRRRGDRDDDGGRQGSMLVTPLRTAGKLGNLEEGAAKNSQCRPLALPPLAPVEPLANEPAGGTGGIVFVFGGVPCGACGQVGRPRAARRAARRRGERECEPPRRRSEFLTPSVDANPPLCASPSAAHERGVRGGAAGTRARGAARQVRREARRRVRNGRRAAATRRVQVARGARSAARVQAHRWSVAPCDPARARPCCAHDEGDAARRPHLPASAARAAPPASRRRRLRQGAQHDATSGDFGTAGATPR